MPNIELPLFSLCGVAGSITSSASMWECTKSVANQGSSPSLTQCSGFFSLGLNHINMGKWPVSSHFGGLQILCDPELPTAPITSLLSLWPKTPRQRVLSGTASQRFRDCLLEAEGQDQTSVWARLTSLQQSQWGDWACGGVSLLERTASGYFEHMVFPGSGNVSKVSVEHDVIYPPPRPLHIFKLNN